MPAAVAFAIGDGLAASSDKPVVEILLSHVGCGHYKLSCKSCKAGVRAETNLLSRVRCGQYKLFCMGCRAGVRIGTYLLTCGAGMLATQHKGSCSAIDAFSSGPPVTAQTSQGEHHLLLVCHSSVMHWSA